MSALLRHMTLSLTLLALGLTFAQPVSAEERRIHNITLDENAARFESACGGPVGSHQPSTPDPTNQPQWNFLPAFDLEIRERGETAYWKPYVIMIDTTAIPAERLDQIKKQVQELGEREIKAGSRWFWVNNES